MFSCAFCLAFFAVVLWSFGSRTKDVMDVLGPGSLRVTTWNIAAINNNPFEYWISSDDPSYESTMTAVQNFIKSPGQNDVTVGTIITSKLLAEMRRGMKAHNIPEVDAAIREFKTNYKNRRIISDFLKDKSIGSKRLVSMPDRVTNTLELKGGIMVYRPTVINCYTGPLPNISTWWKAWSRFMFAESLGEEKGGVSLLLPINRSKYPALSVEEEKMSIALQAIILAIFDATLVYMMEHTSKDHWEALRTGICQRLNLNKVPRTLDILRNTYKDSEIIFLQEVSSKFVEKAKNDRYFPSEYDIFTPDKMNPKRDQNSVIMVRRRYFNTAVVEEVTSVVQSSMGDENVPVSDGDIFALRIENWMKQSFLLVSFHGDTNGLATIPVFRAVHKAIFSMNPRPKLIFGLDANTHEVSTKKKQGFSEFVLDLKDKGIGTCWGQQLDPRNRTTFNARTYLQPQLNKAVEKEETHTKGDRNPKDFILFFNSEFESWGTTKDNTGEQKYIEDMVFPTMSFPSDHAILSTYLIPK